MNGDKGLRGTYQMSVENEECGEANLIAAYEGISWMGGKTSAATIHSE